MKNKLKKFDTVLVLILKTITYLAVFWAFYRIYAINNDQLLRLTRTTAITIMSFVIAGLLFLRIYGGYDIGKRKSKPIIISLGISSVMTDFVTFVMLSIMKTIPDIDQHFTLVQIWMMIIVVPVQVLIITIMTYLGNELYFKIHDPEKCLVITVSQRSLNEIAKGICKYKKQYKISAIADYRNPDVKKLINENETIFLYDVPVTERTKIIEYCYQNMKEVYFNPSMADVVERAAGHVVLDDISVLCISSKGLSMDQKIMKRIFDVVISVLALIISSPIMLIAAIAIKIEDKGSILFKQNRATLDGKIFNVYKLRTMKEDVVNFASIENDDRITKVGHVLRRFRLDEVPQFLNVIKGDMSIVGPRPEMLSNVFNYTSALPEFEYRLKVKAGITGYAQIAGKYNTSPRDKLVLDLMYIEEYSLWLDIKLLFQTFMVIFKKDSTEAFGAENDFKIEGFDGDVFLDPFVESGESGEKH